MWSSCESPLKGKLTETSLHILSDTLRHKCRIPARRRGSASRAQFMPMTCTPAALWLHFCGVTPVTPSVRLVSSICSRRHLNHDCHNGLAACQSGDGTPSDQTLELS